MKGKIPDQSGRFADFFHQLLILCLQNKAEEAVSRIRSNALGPSGATFPLKASMGWVHQWPRPR